MLKTLIWNLEMQFSLKIHEKCEKDGKITIFNIFRILSPGQLVDIYIKNVEKFVRYNSA